MARDQTSDFQRLVDTDPELQRLFGLARSGAYVPAFGATPEIRDRSKAIHDGITARLETLFGSGGLPDDYAINAKTGRVARAGFFERNADWIVPAATFGGAYGLSLLPAFGPAAAATAGHSTGGGLATGAATGGFNAAGTTGAILGGGAAAKGISSLLSNPDFWGLLAGIGTNIYSAKTQADAANDANKLAEDSAKRQADALEKAIALQEKMFNLDRGTQAGLYSQNRSDLAPYRAAGQGSVGKLSYLLGVPGFEGGPMSHAPGPEMNPFVPPSPIAGYPGPLQGPAGSTVPGDVIEPMPTQPRPMAPTQSVPPPSQQMATLQAPDGSQRQVPLEQVDFFVSRGARRIA